MLGCCGGAGGAGPPVGVPAAVEAAWSPLLSGNVAGGPANPSVSALWGHCSKGRNREPEWSTSPFSEWGAHSPDTFLRCWRRVGASAGASGHPPTDPSRPVVVGGPCACPRCPPRGQTGAAADSELSLLAAASRAAGWTVGAVWPEPPGGPPEGGPAACPLDFAQSVGGSGRRFCPRCTPRGRFGAAAASKLPGASGGAASAEVALAVARACSRVVGGMGGEAASADVAEALGVEVLSPVRPGYASLVRETADCGAAAAADGWAGRWRGWRRRRCVRRRGRGRGRGAAATARCGRAGPELRTASARCAPS